MSVDFGVAAPDGGSATPQVLLSQDGGQTQEDWTFYFLDWRPVSAAPIGLVGPIRRKEVTRRDLEPYLQGRFIVVPKVDALKSATLLARTDGLFVVRIELEPTAQFDLVNLDELALVICMAAKEKLGHHHDVHSPKPFNRRTAIEPANLLITYPIELQPEDWEEHFRSGSFNDRDLKRCECVPPLNVSENETPRNALVCLRRAYLKVFEATQAIVNLQRKQQIRWQRSPLQIWRMFVLSVILITTLYLTVVEQPATFDAAIPFFPHVLVSPKFLLSSAILLPLAWIFFSNLTQILRFDRPRIRLLRSAETFYTYANPINQILSRVFKDQTLNQVDGFNGLIATLQSKTAGELHRAALHQQWLSLSLAMIAVFFSALAIRQEIALPKTEPAQIAGLDCGQKSWTVGPFKLGAENLLETSAKTPENIVAEVLDAAYGRSISFVVVLGSTNRADFLSTSPVQSNVHLADMRASWVSMRIREEFLERNVSISEIILLNNSIDLTRVMFGENDLASDREVHICIKWEQRK